ncbi:MAG: hypothetical protein Q7S56_03915 [Nanoarchaeota archaeon]|nr:hypothetical protein [Nanoarchaeota archaeon]
MSNIYDDLNNAIKGKFYFLGNELVRATILLPQSKSVEVIYDKIDQRTGEVIGHDRIDLKEAYLLDRVQDVKILSRLEQQAQSAQSQPKSTQSDPLDLILQEGEDATPSQVAKDLGLC